MPTYDVWLMTDLKVNKRIASTATLKAAHATITPKMRESYIYILKWVPVPKQPTPSLLRSRQPVYVWGCLCGQVHTSDMRESVRRILRSD